MSNSASHSSVRKTAVRTSKNAFMLLAGTMTRMVASFAFTIYAASELGVEGFGKFSIAVHYFELFLSLTATSVGILLTRDVARWPRHALQLLSSSIAIVFVLWFVAPPTMWGLGVAFNYSPDTVLAICLASVALLPAAISTVFEAMFVARERAEFVTLGTAIESLGRIILSFLALWLGYGLLGLVFVLLVVRTLLLLSYSIGLARLGLFGWQLNFARTRRFFFRWRVFAAENWMATIYTNLDMLILSWLSGEVAAGLYSAAWKIVRLGTVVAKSYTTAVFPVMSRMYAESQESFSRLYRHTIRIMCAIALPAIAVISVVPDRVISLLFNSEFDEAANVLRVLIWVLLIEFLNPFLSHTLFAQGKQHRSMHVAAISLAVNSVFTYLLVKQFAEVGAAMGTVIGGLVATICYLCFAMPKREIAVTGLVGLRVLTAAIGLGFVVFAIREYSWFALLLTSVAVYSVLLFVVGAVRLQDLAYFRNTFLVRSAA